MPRLIYDIIPPKGYHGKTLKKREFSNPAAIKIIAFLTIVVLSWSGLAAVYQTISYLSDTETAAGSFSAGALDFILSSPSDFTPVALAPGESATRTIEIINTANIPQYNITAASFTGELCQYLNAEVSLDGGDILYSGTLEGFAYGPVVFEAPDVWNFNLTLPLDAPEGAQGQTCQYNSVFFGSQTRNNLPFGAGFNDTEEIGSNLASKFCFDSETRPKGYWKNHESVYLPHLPQNLGNETISTEAMVNQVFDDYNLSMRNKLKGQLLAMKFNAAHFGAGDYFVASEGKTINQIITEADDLLLEDPEPSQDILEAMKDLLESLVDLQMWVCSLTPPPSMEEEEESVPSNIVINEFLPNPTSTDNALMPNGEWIELYNNTGADVDMAGWWLYDAQDSHELAITDANTDTGDTLISNGGFLVVYRNGDNDFSLNNTGGDSIKLYDGPISTGNLIDSHIYTVDAPEGKSFARIPDGSTNWVDPIPTPGEPNTLEGENVIFGEAISELDEMIEDEAELLIPLEIESENSQSTIAIYETIIEETPVTEESVAEEPVAGEPVAGEPATEVTVEEIPIIEEQPIDQPAEEPAPAPEPEPEPGPEPINESIDL